MKTGDKVKFTGASIEQTRWGSNDDPYKFLIEGDEVTVRDVEVHSWHTKLYFVEIPGKYNSVCFEPVAILTLPEEKKNTMENMTKEQQFNLPAAVFNLQQIVFNLQQIALADDDMVKAPGAAEKYRFIARHILELFAASGSVAAPKEERVCPKCGSYKVIMFTSDDDLCQSCGATFPGVLNGSSELASLRQQLEQKTIALDSYYKLAAEVAPLKEALKELLPIAEKELSNEKSRGDVFLGGTNYEKYKAIIERARKLINKLG